MEPLDLFGAPIDEHPPQKQPPSKPILTVSAPKNTQPAYSGPIRTYSIIKDGNWTTLLHDL